MNVGGLFEFTLPDDAPEDYLRQQLERMRGSQNLASPWNLRPVEGPLVGARLPLMQKVQAVDLDYHVRLHALPRPGGQRELGVLVSQLHGHQLDLHRPLWEVHLIEGLEKDRFAIYIKLHHAVIDGVSGMRMILGALSTDPEDRETPPFWTVGPGGRSSGSPSKGPSGLGGVLQGVRGAAAGIGGLGAAVLDLARAAVDDSPLTAPFMAPGSVLGGRIEGQRRFATKQFELERIKALAKAGDCTLNDVVLYICGSALRRYLSLHANLPSRSLTAGIPVSLREVDDSTPGTAIGILVAELGTNLGDPVERLESIKRSTAAAKKHLASLPREALASQIVVMNGPYITGLLAGLGGHAPIPFNVGISNVPGPPEARYLSGSRMDAIFPVSLLMHGNALNITCVSYAGTLNFGLIGARDTLPHLQRLAGYMDEAVDELSRVSLAHAS